MRWIAATTVAGALVGGCLVDLGPPIPAPDAGPGPSQTSTVTTDASSEPPDFDPPDATSDDSQGDDDDVIDDATDDTSTDGSPDDDVVSDTDDVAMDDTPPDESEAGPVPTGDGDTGCGPNQEACDGGCVPLNSCEPPPPPCEETCILDHAESTCISDECTLVSCEDGWVDCDGLPENGCEAAFGTEVSESEPLEIPRATILTDDDWGDIPVYPMKRPCGDCGVSHSGVPEQVAIYAGEAPPDDMRASFSMAWDDSGMWLRTIIFDDEWVETIAPDDGSGNGPDPRLYDHIEFVFDGVNLTNYGEPQDHHLFIGIDTDIFDQREPPDTLRQRVGVELETRGVCRILTTKLSDAYLSNGQMGQFIAVGEVYGFAISYDDFDYNDAQPMTLERQHHLFYKSPGQNYVYGPRQLPEMIIAE
jgi:hypothetical protein